MKKIKKFLIKCVKKYLFEKIVSRDESFKVENGDIFLISYPKSWDTWIRFVLTNIIYSNEIITPINIEDKIIDIYKKNNKFINKKRRENKINIFKSHSFFRQKFSKNKVIYIVRDFRDVLISYYYHLQKKKRINIKFDVFFEDFINGKIDNFGSWGKNVGSWLSAKKNDKDNFLLVRFEDLKSKSFNEIKRVCDFLKLNVDDKIIKKAIKYSSFEYLRDLESKFEKKLLITKGTNFEIKFFRNGNISQWKTMLNREKLNIIEKKYGYFMRELDYLS